ncbi:MAG: hypothetical protein QOC89_4337, partial [Paraburkholderia sp.]|nr:hypothetical protein [Paraburkholderia sp.]
VNLLDVFEKELNDANSTKSEIRTAAFFV